MKIAYLISAHTNPIHLARLISSLDYKYVDFFVHIDKKNEDKFNISSKDNIHIIKNNINVFWGTYSIVETALLMLKEAKKTDKYDYYIWLSESDYPLKSNNEIRNYLKNNYEKEFINICKMPENDKSLDRVEKYYLPKRNNVVWKNIVRNIANQILNIIPIKRRLPSPYNNFVLYGGSQWWAFSDSAVDYILNFIKKAPEYVRFYKRTYIPDEMFFHTILGNSEFKKNITNSFTYTDWRKYGGPLPATIEERHIKELKKEFQKTGYGDGKIYFLFARKFNDSSSKIIKIIDNTLRKNT